MKPSIENIIRLHLAKSRPEDALLVQKITDHFERFGFAATLEPANLGWLARGVTGTLTAFDVSAFFRVTNVNKSEVLEIDECSIEGVPEIVNVAKFMSALARAMQSPDYGKLFS